MNKYYILHSKPSCAIISKNFMQNRIDAQFYSSEYLTKEKIEFDNGLDYVELGEIGTNFSYGTPPYGHICDKGVPYLRIPDIEDDFFLSDSNIAFIDEEYHLKNIRNEVKAGDILFRIKGQLGQALVVPQKLSNSHTGSSFLRFTPKSINPYFLVCYLNSSFGCNQINRKQSNSIIQYLNIDDITSIRVPIPSPEIQKYIGDKVRKAEELREEAKRLKKEAVEIIYKKLGNIILEDEKNYTANYIREKDIFERIDSEYYKEKYFRLQKQLKSKGFSLKTLDELCDSNIFNGRTYKTTNKKRKYMNIGVGELGDWFILENGDKYIDENINTNYLLDRYSIIWGNSAHLAKYIGEKVNINLETNLYIPTTEITCIKPNLDKINPYYLFLYMKSNWGYYQIQRTVKGMTAHSYPEDVSKIIVPILDFSLEELNVMKSAVELGYRYTKESKQLIQEAKQDVEDLIEGNFDISKVKANS
jgi:hypothetical protein